MTTANASPPAYWYGDTVEDTRGSRVMEAMRAYRSAEMAMRRRTQDAMDMGENELTVLRFLTRETGMDHDVTPVDVARHLGVSSASTTALIDRLEKTGHLLRRPHPSDRRKVLITPTRHADHEMRDTLAMMHERMMRAARGMTDAETATVIAFLQRMRCAVADTCSPTDDGCCASGSALVEPPADTMPEVAA